MPRAKRKRLSTFGFARSCMTARSSSTTDSTRYRCPERTCAPKLGADSVLIKCNGKYGHSEKHSHSSLRTRPKVSASIKNLISKSTSGLVEQFHRPRFLAREFDYYKFIQSNLQEPAEPKQRFKNYCAVITAFLCGERQL